MGKLVAIGGGNLSNRDTLTIDKKIITLTGKSQPRILFVPAAMKDDQGYAKRIKQYFRSLGCEIDAIRLFHTKKSELELHQLFLNYDVIYLGGGDTERLMNCLCHWKLDIVLKQAYEQGIVIAGMSAGANVLFTYGYSDTEEGFKFVKGIGLVDGVFTPHIQDRPCFDQASSAFTQPCIGCKDAQAYIVEDELAYLFP